MKNIHFLFITIISCSLKTKLGLSENFRGFISHQHCLKHDIDYMANNLNGALLCSGATCKLKCSQGYDYWRKGGKRRISCKSRTGKC